MRYKLTPELITAMKNLITIAEEHYDTRRVIDADDVIVLNSAQALQRVITEYETNQDVLEPYLHEEVEYLINRKATARVSDSD